MKVILAAIGRRSGSDGVVSRAIQLATEHSARFTLLHGITAEAIADVAGASGRPESELRNQLKTEAYLWLERLLVEGGRPRRGDVRAEFGSPHEVITRAASEMSADLIVMGAHKSQSLSAKLLGSTADRGIRTSAVPILVVKSRSAQPYRKVAVAIDFSPQSEAASKEARNRGGFDLLALGAHRRGFVLQALLGSVAQRVLREAACDVMVASPRR